MGDDDSSSDDEPMMSSPDASSNEDDDAVFKFHAHKFQKSTVKELTPSPPSSGRKRRSRKERLSLEDQLLLMEHKKQLKVKKFKDRISRKDNADDSDSDEDVNVNVEVVAANGNSNGNTITMLDDNSDSDDIEVIEPPSNYTTTRSNPSSSYGSRTTRTRRPPKKSNNDDVVELLDDSSDDNDGGDNYNDVPRGSEMPLTAFKGASKEAMEAIQRSRMARTNLSSAQQYHAEDIHVPVQSPPRPTIDSLVVIPSPQQQQLLLPKKQNLGKSLRVTCRIQLEFNGKHRKTDDTVLTIRENEPLQVLLGKFLKAHDLLPSARVTMSFDGMTLLMTRTPASYEMEDEDLIDVTAKAIAMIPLQVKTNNKPMPRRLLTLTLRRKMGKNKVDEQVLQLGQTEPFQTLLDSYTNTTKVKVTRRQTISFHFDGGTLDLQKTPAQYDMQPDDLIDVIIR